MTQLVERKTVDVRVSDLSVASFDPVGKGAAHDRWRCSEGVCCGLWATNDKFGGSFQ